VNVPEPLIVWILNIIIMADQSSRNIRERAPSFKLEVPGDSSTKEIIRSKLTLAKTILSSKMNKLANYADVLTVALNSWLESEGGHSHGSATDASEAAATSPEADFVQVQIATREQAKQQQYVTCRSSLEKLLETTQHHRNCCQSALKWQSVQGLDTFVNSSSGATVNLPSMFTVGHLHPS